MRVSMTTDSFLLHCYRRSLGTRRDRLPVGDEMMLFAMTKPFLPPLSSSPLSPLSSSFDVNDGKFESCLSSLLPLTVRSDEADRRRCSANREEMTMKLV